MLSGLKESEEALKPASMNTKSKGLEQVLSNSSNALSAGILIGNESFKIPNSHTCAQTLLELIPLNG